MTHLGDKVNGLHMAIVEHVCRHCSAAVDLRVSMWQHDFISRRALDSALTAGYTEVRANVRTQAYQIGVT